MAKRRNRDFETEDQIEGIRADVNESQDFFTQNRNMIFTIAGLLTLLVVGFVIYKFMFQAPKEEAAKAAIYKAEMQFQRDSFAVALEYPNAEAEGFLDIIENYGGTKTANLAKLYAGISYLNLGRYDDAIEYLESHSAGGTYGAILKNGNLGDAYSEKNEMSQAITFYEKATKATEDDLLTPYYLYKLGLLAKKNGDNAKALSALQRIKDSFPDSEEGRKVSPIIAALSS